MISEKVTAERRVVLSRFRAWDAYISKRFILWLARVCNVELPKEKQPIEWILHFPRNNRATAALASKFRKMKHSDRVAQKARR